MMRFDRFTERAQEAAQRAAEIIQRYGHNQIDTEHILLALIEQPQGVITQLLEILKVDPENFKERLDYILRTSPKANIFGGGAGQVFITPRVKRIIDQANEEANRLKDEYISTEHIFLAILGERNTPAARLLEDLGITRQRVLDAVDELRGGQKVNDPKAESRYRTLEKYSRDLTTMAREGKLDPVIGRDTEILRLIQILSRRTKNNPVLIGEAGVGKTAIVEGLSQKVASNDVPEILMGKKVVSLDLGAMIAGSGSGVNLKSGSRPLLKKSNALKVRSSSSSMSYIPWLALAQRKAQWMPPTCSSPPFQGVSCSVLARPRWMNITSTLKKTQPLSGVLLQSMWKNQAWKTRLRCCAVCGTAMKPTIK